MMTNSGLEKAVAEPEKQPPTLFTFLGTGKYEPTRYLHPDTGQELMETPFVACALVKAFAPRAVKAFLTEAAEDAKGKEFREAFEGLGVVPEVIRIPEGKNPEERWQLFRILSEHLRQTQGQVLLDITHGYRSLPFFAGAVAAYVRALAAAESHFAGKGEKPPQIRIVYGAFEAREGGPRSQPTPASRPEGVGQIKADEPPPRTPIWDLTVFLDVLDWAWAVHMFLATGRAAALADLVMAVDRQLVAKQQAARQPVRSFLKPFAQALQEFSDDLATVRIGRLLLAEGKNQPSTVERLARALEGAKPEIQAHLPPVVPLLALLEGRLEPLRFQGHHLAGPEGKKPMAALARLYLDLDRFSETAIVLREGWVNLFAQPEAACLGPAFDREARNVADRRFGAESLKQKALRTVAELRNDLEHGGFNPGPRAAKTVREQLEQFCRQFEAAPPPENQPPEKGKVWFVTRHPGAREWAAQQGLHVDFFVEHLDPSQVSPGDTVIGTLPLHLAAAVCEAGARLLHLSMDVPPDRRGQELTAEEMAAFGARLEEMTVTRSEQKGKKR